MASIKYEILTHFPPLPTPPSRPTKNTWEQYKTNTIRFGKWAKKTYGYRTFAQLTEHIMEILPAYSAHLQSEGKTAATIHTYLAGCCFTWGIPLDLIPKPTRHCHTATRSRGTKEVDKRFDATREASPHLYDFASKVGIRRREYLALRGCNFRMDESGYPCVEVKKGKGGKYQLQRVMPEDVEYVRAYFNGTENYVFKKDEMKNKIDLHHIRAEVAQRAYKYYSDRLSCEPGYRQQLEKEIEARWCRYRGTPRSGTKKKSDWEWDISRVRGEYRIRGENRKKAIHNGLPTVFDRLAVMAVSVFHLSHWRCDVTVGNYLLAI